MSDRNGSPIEQHQGGLLYAREITECGRSRPGRISGCWETSWKNGNEICKDPTPFAPLLRKTRLPTPAVRVDVVEHLRTLALPHG